MIKMMISRTVGVVGDYKSIYIYVYIYIVHIYIYSINVNTIVI